MLPPAVPYKMKAHIYGKQGTTSGLDTKPRAGEYHLPLPTKKGLELDNEHKLI